MSGSICNCNVKSVFLLKPILYVCSDSDFGCPIYYKALTLVFPTAMFNPTLIASGVESDFADPQIAAFAPDAAKIAYGTAGFRTIGTALPPVAYRCVFLVFCRSLAVRQALSTSHPVDSHHFVINPATIGDCGMMITASHNPAPDNGLKIVDPDGGMYSMAWEADTTEVANTRNAEAFGAALVQFARQYVLLGANGNEEAILSHLLKERPVRVHIGRDTRHSGDAILRSIGAAAATINRIFGSAIYDSASYRPVIELVDHGVLTTPILHAMVYWNRHHHELPIVELGLCEPKHYTTITGRGIAQEPQLVRIDSVPSSSLHEALLSSRHHNVDDSVAAAAKSSLTHCLATPVTRHLNERLVFRSFVSLWEELGAGVGSHGKSPMKRNPVVGALAGNAVSSPLRRKKVIIDCSNGVGSVVMQESLALPIAVLPEDHKYIENLVAAGSDPSGLAIKSAEMTIRDLVQHITGIEFELVHVDITDKEGLNKNCGADHTQKTRKPSILFHNILNEFALKHKQELATDLNAFLKDHPTTISGAAPNLSPIEAFCHVLSQHISFYCFDGDADRVVSFAPSPNHAATASGINVQNIEELLSAVTLELLDGDRIAVLLSSLVRDALSRTNSATANSLVSGVSHAPVPQPRMGVVQTAYANGASTNYILSKLHIPTVCAATGVKYLHPKAEAMEVGIYFEANGHGTALSSAALFASNVTLENTKSRSRSDSGLGAGSIVHPGVTPPPAPKPDSPSNLTRTSSMPSHVADRTIVPYLWFGGNAQAPQQIQGLKNLLLMRYLLSQCCGDAISDMLACELSLAALGWTAYSWLTLYQDLPSITGKTLVRDPSVIQNTPDQRHVTHPPGLQARIDQIVESLGGSRDLVRSFVRPSGTEPIVRVYAEAKSVEVTQELFSKVAEAVREMCP